MKKLVLVLATIAMGVPLCVTCGSDEVARAVLCDDVCEKFVDDCLGVLPGQTRETLEDLCLDECDESATREELICVENSTCADIFLGACWGLD